MLNRFILFVCGWLLATGLKATDLAYHVSFDTKGQYIRVNLSATNVTGESTLLQMPVWAPGYYLIVDYPKNVVDFAATDTNGAPLAWEKQGKGGWLIKQGSRNAFNVSYLVYANAQSVAESMVNPGKAFVAPNGVFLYVEGEKEKPITVTFEPVMGWSRVSTGLEPVSGKRHTYVAANADVLYDCPAYLGNQTIYDFRVDGRDYHLMMETPDGVNETTFLPDLKKMIHAATQLFNDDTPYNHYTFILMGAGGGGLEHTNSQACFTSGSFRFKSRAAYVRFLSFITHEFFHLYNVKTIRPIELGPFDYTQEVFTPSLWISEGFTVYYESIIMRRAGLIDTQTAVEMLDEYIQAVETKNGHKHMSLRQSSYDIWLNFFNRNANGAETRISYYDKGPILGLLMDIEIRHLTNNEKSLDDLMRRLYFGYHKEMGRGFTEEEFWKEAAAIAGQPLERMRRYVDTTDEIDYAACLDQAGLMLDANGHLQLKPCTGLAKQIQQSIL